MTLARRVVSVMLLAAVPGLPCRAQTLQPAPAPEVEYDKTWDFGRYKTFAWAPFLDPAPNATTHRLLVGAIERGLVGHGLGLVPGEKADVYVNYWVKAETRVEGTPSVDRAPRWGANDQRVVIEFKEARVGTLVIELWDGVSRSLVWRSKVSGALGTTQEVQQQIDHIVDRMLADYPGLESRNRRPGAALLLGRVFRQHVADGVLDPLPSLRGRLLEVDFGLRRAAPHGALL